MASEPCLAAAAVAVALPVCQPLHQRGRALRRYRRGAFVFVVGMSPETGAVGAANLFVVAAPDAAPKAIGFELMSTGVACLTEEQEPC